MNPVVLLGGPAHGATIEIADTRLTINVEGHGVPEGYAARYRPGDARRRVNHAFRFDGLTRIVARLALPHGGGMERVAPDIIRRHQEAGV